VKKAANEVLSDPKLAIPGMLYAPDEGDHRLRETLAQWLSEFYSTEEPIGAERITITGGASQNIGCVFQTFTDPVYTRNVWIVAPTYMLIFRMIDDAGLHHKLRAVPEDEQGIDIDYLRKEIEKSERQALAAGNTHPVSAILFVHCSRYGHLKKFILIFSCSRSSALNLWLIFV